MIDEEKFVIDDMGGTVEITLESDEDPGYLLTIKLGKNEDEGIYTIGYMNGEESVSSDLEGNSFNVKISYNSSSFSIEINDKEVAPFTEFKNATGITVRCNNVAGESDLDLIYIESVNSDWEITN